MARKRVEAAAADAAPPTAPNSMVRGKDGSAFARWFIIIFIPTSPPTAPNTMIQFLHFISFCTTLSIKPILFFYSFSIWLLEE